jgi:hypothetical protein
MNPAAMSKPVPKSKMLPGSGVADTDSSSLMGRSSEIKNCRNGLVELEPVKTTLTSGKGKRSSPMIIIPVVPTFATSIKSLLRPVGGVSVTPGQAKVVTGLDSGKITELLRSKLPALDVQTTGDATVNKGATRTAGTNNRPLLNIDRMFIVLAFGTLLFIHG